MIKWITVEDCPRDNEIVVVKCKSGYGPNDYVFKTARYQPTYRPLDPWQSEAGNALSDGGLTPFEYTRDLNHSAPPPDAIVITEDSTEGIEPEFHSIVKEYGRSMFATLINAGQANSTAEVLSIIVTRLQNAHGRDALAALVQTFNQLNVAYLAEMQWDEKRMVACNKEIQAVMQIKVLRQVPTILGTDGQPLKH